MDIYYSLLVLCLAALFFLILFLALRQKSYAFKVIKSGNDANIEARLRILMRKNPKSEIVVINNSAFLETAEILEKMQCDFPRVHIVTY